MLKLSLMFDWHGPEASVNPVIRMGHSSHSAYTRLLFSRKNPAHPLFFMH